MASSHLIEFIIAVVVGALAILGGLFVIGFLLVEPIRFPNGLEEAVQASSVEECETSTRDLVLPPVCRFEDGSSSYVQQFCDQSLCTTSFGQCSDPERRCCCIPLSEDDILEVMDIECDNGTDPAELVPFNMRANATSCVCDICDDVLVDISVTVITADGLPISAAQIIELSNNTVLGITALDGTFMFFKNASTRTLELRVIASGFFSQDRQVNIDPGPPQPIEVTIRLMEMQMQTVGLGSSAILLPLGQIASVAAPPNSFIDNQDNSTSYQDLINWVGMFALPEDEQMNLLPPASTVFETADGARFGVALVTFLEFTDIEGETLTANSSLELVISVQGTMDDNTLFLVAFNESSGFWEDFGFFSVLDLTRRKRQMGTEILVHPDVPVGQFAAVAIAVQAECWLQARTFTPEFGVPLLEADVVLEQESTITGNEFLFRFGTRTNSLQTTLDGLQSNALCLPLACDNFTVATLQAAFNGEPITPQDFNSSIFAPMENPPISFGDIFSFEELTTTQEAGGPRPFYADQDSCVANGQEAMTDASFDMSDFFSFNRPAGTPSPPPTENCYIKIQVLDCSANNTIMVMSTNPDTGSVSTTMVPAIDEDDTTTAMPMEFSGTPPPDDVCNAMIDTVRAACVPFTCQYDLQVNVQSDRINDFCDLTRVSVVLSSDVLTAGSGGNQLFVSTSPLRSDDFGDENLGLYHDPSPTMAMQSCNAGEMGVTATEIDVMTGYAAVFTCYPE